MNEYMGVQGWGLGESPQGSKIMSPLVTQVSLIINEVCNEKVRCLCCLYERINSSPRVHWTLVHSLEKALETEETDPRKPRPIKPNAQPVHRGIYELLCFGKFFFLSLGLLICKQVMLTSN